MAKLVSHVYGEALFELARQSGQLERFQEELRAVERILEEYPDYVAILEHPQLDEQEKLQVFDRVFGGRISEEMTGFFHILLEKGRFSQLPSILAYFEEQKLAHDKVGVAWVTSAVELTQQQRERIVQRLLDTTQYRSMQMNYSTDPALIGGLVIRIGDRVVDSSMKSRLEDMKRELMKIQLS